MTAHSSAPEPANGERSPDCFLEIVHTAEHKSGDSTCDSANYDIDISLLNAVSSTEVVQYPTPVVELYTCEYRI